MPDFELPVRYLKRNFAPADRIAVVQIDPRQHEAVQALREVDQVRAPQYQAHLRAANANGKDLYVSMNTLKPEAQGRTKADIAAVKHVYLDLDNGGQHALDRILKAQELPAPHEVLESSPGKFQILWRVQEFEAGQAEALMKQLAREYGADPAATDVSRVLRLPGFRNWKYEAAHYVREVKPGGEHPVWTPADFPQIARDPELQRPAFGGGRPAGTGGTQSERDFAYAMRQLERGTPAEHIRSRIAEYRSTDGKHADPAAYAARTVGAAQRQWLRSGGISSTEGEGREQSGLER
jgi:hypothetical protein